MILNAFLQKYKGIYSNENKNRLLQTQIEAMLEVVLHFAV